jgi:hypothetical protein
MIKRRYVLFTDDEVVAQDEVLARRQSASTLSPHGYHGWDMAAVADLVDPPKTSAKFCVFQIPQNK